MKVLIILVTTFVAAILSSMSGGGTSIINIPVFLALGMSYPDTIQILQTFFSDQPLHAHRLFSFKTAEIRKIS
jgi:uncharacterized membrane protein YfcA